MSRLDKAEQILLYVTTYDSEARAEVEWLVAMARNAPCACRALCSRVPRDESNTCYACRAKTEPA